MSSSSGDWPNTYLCVQRGRARVAGADKEAVLAGVRVGLQPLRLRRVGAREEHRGAAIDITLQSRGAKSEFRFAEGNESFS